MISPIRFPYLDAIPSMPGSSLMPLLPITLSYGTAQVEALGLLDTGAPVNVLPYSLGEALGLVWEGQPAPITLSGNLARLPARGVVISAQLSSLGPVRLAFAWTKSNDVRLLIWQANFFMEFDVCFFRSRAEFGVNRKAVI